MKNKSKNIIRNQSQLDRLIFFSDAVFAIAITILIIDVKVPDLQRPVTEAALIHSLVNLLPKFTGFLLSFFLIGLYWTIHHRLFGYVKAHSVPLLWINLVFLLGIVVLPFTTSFYSEYVSTLLKTPIILYSLNICYIGILSYLLHNYVTHPGRKMVEGMSRLTAKYYALRALTIPVIFGLIILVSLFNPLFALFIPPLVPLMIWGISVFYKKVVVPRQKIRKDNTITP